MKIIAWLAGIGTLLGGAHLHDRLAEPVGVEPRAVLRPHRRHRRDRSRDGTRSAATQPHRAPREVDPEIAEIFRATRPPSRDRFAWLQKSTGKFNVFITFIVGGGLILSGVAWIVDRSRGEDVDAGG